MPPALPVITATPASGMPYRQVAFGPYAAHVEPRPDGSLVLRAQDPLRAYPGRFTEHLVRWAAERPGQPFLARRAPGPLGTPGRPWLTLSYADALDRVQRLAQALLDLGLSAERPLALLSANDFEHALLTLAALHVGIPAAPISPSYSLLDPQAARVSHAMARLTPGLVFAADGAAYARAIARAVPPGVPLLLAHGALPGPLPGREVLRFDDLQATLPTAAVHAAHARVHGDTLAKFLFTSGSTQAPKAVINTHRMLCANQQMYVQCYPFLEDTPPVLVDWLPWHHTAGGNSNLGLVLRNGGTLYIDEGKPTPEGMAETLLNLREISPTAIYTVPKGLEVLAHAMQTDGALRERVFERLQFIFAAGAAMPQAVVDLMDHLAVQATGCRIPMTMGLGMTESAPFAVSHHRPGWQQGAIGLPAPGLALKLAPVGDKLEVRYRGPSITPGYWRQQELHATSFDEEGFFRSGDAVAFIDPADVQRGLRFDGRIAEDFKLITGTWVNVAAVRARAMAQALPYVHDVVVTGDGHGSLGLLVFLAPAAAQLTDAGAASDAAGTSNAAADAAAWAADPGVRRWARQWLDVLAATATGSASRVTRAMLMSVPPALGDITDKGSLNQRAVLKARADLVEALYAAVPDARVLCAAAPGG
jgi:feruloyl-CoA synthase